MLLTKLEKNVQLYRNQFEYYTYQMYGDHRLDRLSLDLDAILFRIKYMTKHNRDVDRINDYKDIFTTKAAEMRKCFSDFLFNFLCTTVTITAPFHLDDIVDVMAQDVKIDSSYVRFKMILITSSEGYAKYVDETIPEDKVYNMFPNKYFRFSTDSYNDGIVKAYPELFENKHIDIGTGDDGEVFVHNLTLQTSERCSLNCFPEGTDILMGDFSHKDISDIKVGDIVLGFEENSTGQFKQKTLLRSEVLSVSSHYESCFKISHPKFKKDLYVTPEHPFWTARQEWVMAKDLRPSDGLMITSIDPYDYYLPNTDSIDYIAGYFIGGWLGDGTAISRQVSENGVVMTKYHMRFVVKDQEMNDRMEDFAIKLGFDFNKRDFQISTKYNIWRKALHRENKESYIKFWELVDKYFNSPELRKNPNFLMGYAAGLYDAEGNSFKPCGSVSIYNSDINLLNLFGEALDFLHISYSIKLTSEGVNKPVYKLFIVGGIPVYTKFFMSCKNVIKRKRPENSFIGKSVFKKLGGSYDIEYVRDAKKVYNFETTTHTYIANRLMVHNCSYCYQFSKSEMRMSFETAKIFIDKLLNDEYTYINRYNSPALILEFIGGEPLLEINLTRKIYEYFLDRCYELNHPWFTLHRLSICSNGMQYFDDAVQDFFKEYASQISFNISIDGNKRLHDSCRRQPNGEGSYDIDMCALNHYNKYHNVERNSKMTLSPQNISYLYESVIDFIKNGMTVININCVFEEGWNVQTAIIEYEQLKKLADYLLENDLESIYIAVFKDRQEDAQPKEHDSSSCGGGGSMLAVRPNGQFYPCLRYMPSSVGNDVKDLCMGDIKNGMIGREENSEVLHMLDDITRRSQTNDTCYECPIASACASCMALSHTVFGTPNKRASFICLQMIAEHLASCYYWNLMKIKHPSWDIKPRHLMTPDEWNLIIIDKEELNFIKYLESMALITEYEQHIF